MWAVKLSFYNLNFTKFSVGMVGSFFVCLFDYESLIELGHTWMWINIERVCVHIGAKQ